MKHNVFLKRLAALCLTLVMAVTSVPVPAAAMEREEGKAEMVMRYNIFENKSFSLYGHSHRSMTYYMVGSEDGSVPAFCLQPGRRLPNFTASEYKMYPVKPELSVPVIGSFKRYLPMTLSYEWMLENYYDKPRYGVVQTYIWGCMAGFELDWKVQEQTMRRLAEVMEEPRVLTLYEEMKAYITEGVEAYYSSEGSSLPSWNGTVQSMTLKDGVYQLTLDISSCPQLKTTIWSFPGSGWGYETAPDGSSVTFRYSGGGIPSGEISSAELDGIDTRFFAYIFQPPEPFQMQMGWLDMSRPPAAASFSLGENPSIATEQGGDLELYRHSEVFESNYNIDLEKYCSETGQRLEGASFQVWEDFDRDQVNTAGYTEGEPDHSFGEIYLNCMSPEPPQNYLCDIITTDADGYGSHSDFRNYNYSKTYCMGHPAPEWIECDHEGGEGEEECGCDEENERLRQQWMTEQDLCSQTCDFHVQNEDEDNRSQDPGAREEMLADRDASYEAFIALEYSYTLKEQNARPGYTLHGNHRDDQPVEVVTLTSAQDGGKIRASELIRGRTGTGPAEGLGSWQEEGEEYWKRYQYSTGERVERVKKWFTQTLPEGAEILLDKLRDITEISLEEEAPEKVEKPGKPEEPEGSEGPAEPEKPELPEQPEEPEGPAEPEKPEQPEESEGPAEPEKPELPEQPEESEGPAEPEKPELPEQPEESEGPAEPEKPELPEQPEEPEGPTEPELPEQPEEPEGPTEPEEPELSEQPGKSEDPAESDNPYSALSISSKFRRFVAQPPVPSEATPSTIITPSALPDASPNTPPDSDSQPDSDLESDLDFESDLDLEQDSDLEPDSDPETEFYQYIRHSPEVSPQLPFSINSIFIDSISTGDMSAESEAEEGRWAPGSWLASLFSDESSITLALPDFMDDTLPAVDTSGYGSSSDMLYTFKIWDHRTEGRLYMNKRDLDLYNKAPDASLGQSQGRGTLEGAVYGLFAAQDILHPDGVTGAVYRKHDLTAVAATDSRGDASFLAYTEAPGTRLSEDGTIRPSAVPGLPENLYMGKSVASSSEGFGTITYPNYLEENGSPWIGRPLIMGSYYIRELSRSEGYELSVAGRSQKDTNRTDLTFTVPEAAGQAFVIHGLSENNSMAADGTWNEFVTEYQDTSQGYRMTITGYPEDARFFRVQIKERTETVQTIVGTRKEPKQDALGNPIYQTARGGEYKRDAEGNPIIKQPEKPEDQIPAGETLLYRFRTAPHLQGEAQPEDLSAWNQAIDREYLKEQANSMLRQLGCKGADREQGAPWVNLPLKGDRNSQAAEQILDWFTGHGFYDQGTVDEIYQREGAWYARIYYDNSGGSSVYPAVYDSPSRMLYLRREGMLQDGRPFHYWIPRAEGSFRLDSRRAVIYEKQEIPGSVTIEDDLEALVETVYQPLYETYQPGEPLLDENGSPIPVLADVPVYQDMEMTFEDMVLEEVQSVCNRENGTHTIFAANEVDWSKEPWPHQDTYRAVTKESTIHYQGQEMPYSQYLVQKAGASVCGYVPDPETDPDSYVTFARLEYPGQDHPVQDQGTGDTPVLMLERIIRQPVKVTKDIAKTSYDGVNTYGSIHNDPMTAFLGLFTGKKKHNGIGLLEGFTFKIYLKANLEHLYADEQGNLISRYTARPEFDGEIQTVFQPPEDGTGRPLLEAKEDGTWDYRKFFRALYAAEASGTERERLLKEFAAEYWDVKAYKEELLAAQPDMNSDKAYELAFQRALEEGNAYLKPFRGLEARLAVPWDSEQNGGGDQDKTTLRCSTKSGADHYYGVSLPLPYGTYVIVEQVPEDRQLANRHYQIREPEEAEIPFIPGEENAYFRYCSKDQPEELVRKYKIRFNEESHVIQANGQDGAFEIYKYGRKGETRPDHSRSETGGELNQVIYEGSETDSGQVEIRDHVPTMTGQAMAVDGKYAPMLVPWSVTEPVPGEPDHVYKAYAPEDVENTYYRSGLRIEKKDAETGENILHDGALFKLYAAKRDVKKEEDGRITGTGDVLFGPALDAAGKPVTDLFGQEILYPRVGESNGSSQDLPVRLNQEGIPLYDESQLICQKDHQGNETGIFRAFSTEQEILIEGKTEKQVTGYLETYEPLGAGAYVLVEIQAPEGYTRSRPVAFQIYGDQVSYYEEIIGENGAWQGWQQKPAVRYQYALPLEEGNTQASETVSQIPIEDRPSRVQIHKVEDGDSLTGNQNGLLLRDDQGMEEAGGFDTRVWVNDPGDSLIYQVWGREEKLKARGDVRDITYDSSRGQWTGYVTKAMDTYSEKILEGTEGELEAMEGVKLLYYQDGTFSGKGIQFRISVARAGLALYEAIEIEKTGPGTYKGVAAVKEQGEVTRIINTNTGTHKELRIVGETDQNQPPAGQKIWDAVEVKNPSVELYYYDLKETPNRVSPDTGELQILDQRGNVLCYADYDTGMAYVYDEYGRMLAYRADHEGQKQLVRSIRQEEVSGDIYKDKATKDDENGLPVYYKTWTMNREPEQWITDGVHSIERLPFGAYILQEEQVPYDQGYIQSPYQGLVLKDTDRVQKFFLQNRFTRAAFAKVDIRTQKEIQGAVMTLYRAVTDDRGLPVKEPSGVYKKDSVFSSWVSGYAYDDDGNIKTDEKGDWIPTAEPHWIDHIPVGFYVLEETSCPYDQGYVQSPAMNIDLLETGHVQSFTMEDDFTSVDIEKTDSKTGELLYEDHQALLSLYKASVDEAGNPVYEDGSPVYKEEDRLLTFPAATWQKGQEVASTGRLEPDSSGNRPIMKYDYSYQSVPGTLQGRWYYTELGTVRMEYLPPGSYVLAETENPSGYATAAPVLLRIEDKGHMEVMHRGKLEDIPLKLEVSKVNITGGKEVSGAHMSIYPVKEDGRPEENPLVLHVPVEDGAYEDREAVWVSGLDGCYTEEEEQQGLIPPGFQPGDLKPHVVEYIPEGDYILREETAPYGFLQAVDLPFTVTDTGQVQKTEMIDQIPEGRLELLKTDTDHLEQKLKGALFRLENKTLGTIWAEAETDEEGKAVFEGMPIGRMDQAGKFSPYTYICREIRAAEGHMLTLKPYEFQFPYKDQHTGIISLEYNPTNDSNRIVVEKLLGDSPEYLEGALLRLERRLPEQDSWQLTEEWITGKQPYYIKGLQAGEYRLREVKGPEGFDLLAEPLYFTVEDNMTEVPCLKMRNYTSIVEIQKIRTGSGQLLGGARLELIRKSDNQVISQWTSEEGKGMTFYGLEPGTYIIRELEAPAGYQKAPEREVEITGNQAGVQVIPFENTRITSGGGGGTVPDIRFISFKKTDTAGYVLEGAEFTFYDSSGEVMDRAVSDKNGWIRIRKPADGTYTFRETRAPEGYALRDEVFSFTIQGDAVIKGVYEIKNELLQTVLTKADGVTGEPLKGARLRITSEAGTKEFQAEGVTGEDGRLVLALPEPGTYRIRELEAPEGYEIGDQDYYFTIDSQGKVQGNRTIVNFKEKKRLGIITAFYEAKGRWDMGADLNGEPGSLGSLAAAGDETPLYEAIAAAGICMAGFLICLFFKLHHFRKRKSRSAMVLTITLLTALALAGTAGEVRAADKVRAAGETQAVNEVRAAGEPESGFYIERERIYTGVEGVFKVPETAGFVMEDRKTGESRKVFLPIIKEVSANERWESGFELKVTVPSEPADYYLAGETAVEAGLWETEEGLLKVQDQILGLAGLSPEDYKLEHVVRNGETLLCTGRKRLCDKAAVYGGLVDMGTVKENLKEDSQEGSKEAFRERYGKDPGDGLRTWAVPAALILALLTAGLAGFEGRKHPGLLTLLMLLFLSGTVVSLACLTGISRQYRAQTAVYENLRDRVAITDSAE